MYDGVYVLRLAQPGRGRVRKQHFDRIEMEKLKIDHRFARLMRQTHNAPI